MKDKQRNNHTVVSPSKVSSLLLLLCLSFSFSWLIPSNALAYTTELGNSIESVESIESAESVGSDGNEKINNQPIYRISNSSSESTETEKVNFDVLKITSLLNWHIRVQKADSIFVLSQYSQQRNKLYLLFCSLRIHFV